MDITELFSEYPLLKFIDIVDSAVLFPVLILLFVVYQVNYPQKDSKKILWLFLPFIFSVFCSILDEIDTSTQASLNSYSFNLFSTVLGFLLFFITLFFIPTVLLKTYQVIQFSKDKQEKKWLISLWLFELIFLTSWLLTVVLSIFIEYEITSLMHIIAVFTSLLIHWVAYVGVYKLKLANEKKKIKELISNSSKLEEVKTVSYDVGLSKKIEKTNETTIKTSITSSENIHYQALEALCSKQKIYMDSTLDRNKVADMLGISPSYVSQLINSITNENFSTYINTFRVEEAKKLISNKEFDNYNLLSIGLECGFPSKATYYNWFKKITGMTPNMYRKHINKS
ncbi:helix-turn-helix domain-containing protein [Bernardetia sp. OM2101]|uniref:helix-turn-helix domain-containing protein n=1 Tax=Bernardetia sp. OM2101 TaxID=3344876 RepID=UPI0035CF1961